MLDQQKQAVLAEWQASGVRFWASDPKMVTQYEKAIKDLMSCIKAQDDTPPILQEGGTYFGCWLESTGTINAEILSRFLPSVAENTFSAFAKGQRTDGLFPYKITKDGPAFAQIQTVTPLARSVWNHYKLNGQNRNFLKDMYTAMVANDHWLSQHRNTRGTGGVEAFCCYDTGHDASPRFWHVPDSPFENDPAKYDPANPILPFIAPDLTANVACQRSYLGKIAKELDIENDWQSQARASQDAVFRHCYCDDDDFFYDRDRNDNFVRVQSDILLRVLACEIGDNAFFDRMLRNYLLNTRKFFARFPFTSIAMDDPRFDPNFSQNSWGGPTNFLSIIRAAHAFEHHDRHTELTWVEHPILHALFGFDDSPQTLDPKTGAQGFTKCYSPSILCLLDFVERLCGILPRPDNHLWFTGLVPKSIEHRVKDIETRYSRIVDGAEFTLKNTSNQTTAFRDGQMLYQAPAGLRVVTDRAGEIREIIGMQAGGVSGQFSTAQVDIEINVQPNEQLRFDGAGFERISSPGMTPISHA
ncbi:MAG: MGH1-like glycoside hydrolase domain-containing protein [Marinosulfonomonas sp.]